MTVSKCFAIGAADESPFDLDQNLARPRAGHWHFAQLDAAWRG
jgi:hypothetical protein